MRQTVHVVIDHIRASDKYPRADVVTGVFLTKAKAQAWIRADAKKPKSSSWLARLEGTELRSFDLKCLVSEFLWRRGQAK